MQLGLRATPYGDEFAAVYQAGRGRAVVDDGTRTRAPGRPGLDCEQLSSVIAKELEGVASLDPRQALVDQRLQLAGLDLGAVLFGLARPLGLFVVIECALDALVSAGVPGTRRPA
jgi:hypothetical protein